jgi:alpha-L-fucosidase
MKPGISTSTDKTGAQRLPLHHLRQWEALRFGMFIHYGMSTYAGAELPDGTQPSTLYAPDRLDVDQWVSVARDAGMKYAVLTAKHVAGHCLWPSGHTDYHVGTSGNKTDVVEAFVKACEKRGVRAGLYYCSWDNHHRFGSLTPSDAAPFEKPLNLGNPLSEGVQLSYTTREYQDFQTAQIEELLTHYGRIAEVWIDIPAVLPRCYRQELYRRIADLQPEAVIMMNHGIGDGSNFRVDKAWPSDLVAIERFLPNSHTGHVPWREIEGREYYLPGEVCDPMGKEWFFDAEDQPRSDAELLGMYLLSVSRGTNLLLDVGPDRHGLIPEAFVSALRRLRENIDRFGPV